MIRWELRKLRLFSKMKENVYLDNSIIIKTQKALLVLKNNLLRNKWYHTREEFLRSTMQLKTIQIAIFCG